MINIFFNILNNISIDIKSCIIIYYLFLQFEINHIGIFFLNILSTLSVYSTTTMTSFLRVPTFQSRTQTICKTRNTFSFLILCQVFSPTMTVQNKLLCLKLLDAKMHSIEYRILCMFIIYYIVFKTCVYTSLRYYRCSVKITTYDEIPNPQYLTLYTNIHYRL